MLSAFFLNLVELAPGQAIALAANEPHAYVSGELVECMATSDNVIRAGLTPKLRDTAVLCSSLTYSQVRTVPIEVKTAVFFFYLFGVMCFLHSAYSAPHQSRSGVEDNVFRAYNCLQVLQKEPAPAAST